MSVRLPATFKGKRDFLGPYLRQRAHFLCAHFSSIWASILQIFCPLVCLGYKGHKCIINRKVYFSAAFKREVRFIWWMHLFCKYLSCLYGGSTTKYINVKNFKMRWKVSWSFFFDFLFPVSSFQISNIISMSYATYGCVILVFK